MDHFREEEVLTRPEFASVGREFRRTGDVELPTLLAASALFAAAVLAGGADVVVADALAPFVPTLLALGHGDRAIAVHRRARPDTLGAQPCPGLPGRRRRDRPGPSGRARGAAMARRLRRQARPLRRPAPVRDLASATGYLQRERAVTLAAARLMGWPLIRVEEATELSPGQVLATAQRGLRPWLAHLR